MNDTPVIYLASPIDQGRTDRYRSRAKEGLGSRGCAVYDPAGGWTVPKVGRPSPRLQKANMAALANCDGLLAILDPGVLTIGVTLEIHLATTLGIPTEVWGPDLHPSWSLAYLGLEPHTEIHYALDSLTRRITDV
jgi:nucleoside 2-deoxyribosyltransferase